MPALGADMESGTLVEWLVQPGQPVKRGQIAAVIETQKGAVEVEIWDEGVIDRLLVEPGTRVPVGAVLATLVGIVPGTFVFVNLGQTLGRIDSLRGLVSTETLAAFALLGLFALVPVAIRRLRARRDAPPAAR